MAEEKKKLPPYYKVFTDDYKNYVTRLDGMEQARLWKALTYYAATGEDSAELVRRFENDDTKVAYYVMRDKIIQAHTKYKDTCDRNKRNRMNDPNDWNDWNDPNEPNE